MTDLAGVRATAEPPRMEPPGEGRPALEQR